MTATTFKSAAKKLFNVRKELDDQELRSIVRINDSKLFENRYGFRIGSEAPAWRLVASRAVANGVPMTEAARIELLKCERDPKYTPEVELEHLYTIKHMMLDIRAAETKTQIEDILKSAKYLIMTHSEHRTKCTR